MNQVNLNAELVGSCQPSREPVQTTLDHLSTKSRPNSGTRVMCSIKSSKLTHQRLSLNPHVCAENGDYSVNSTGVLGSKMLGAVDGTTTQQYSKKCLPKTTNVSRGSRIRQVDLPLNIWRNFRC